MPNACPILPPEQRKLAAKLNEIKDAMLKAVHSALQEATAHSEAEVRASGLDFPPPPYNYFVSATQLAMFCHLCKAEYGTFDGGNLQIAIPIIKNLQNIAMRYWGADPTSLMPRTDIPSENRSLE